MNKDLQEKFAKAKKKLLDLGKEMSRTDISKQELKDLKKKKREVLRSLMVLEKVSVVVKKNTEDYRMDLSQKKKDLIFLIFIISFPIAILICVSLAVIVPSFAPILIPIVCVVGIIFIHIVGIGKMISKHNRYKKRKKRIES